MILLIMYNGIMLLQPIEINKNNILLVYASED